MDTGDDSRYSFSPQSTLLARPQSGPTDGVHLTRERVRQVEVKTKQLLHQHLERLETVATRDAA